MSDVETFRSGYIAILGWPNVGKSTLLNSFLGRKISITAPKPQTTRRTIRGILNEEGVQAIFIDTPGWLTPRDSLQASMKSGIWRALKDDADVIVWVVEPTPPTEEHKRFAELLEKTEKPFLVAINKIDSLSAPINKEAIAQPIMRLFQKEIHPYCIAAKIKQGVGDLKKALIEQLPFGPPYFPTDQVTDHWERFYVEEIIREKILGLFHNEVPHASAVKVEEFKEQKDRKDFIRAHIFVETEGQKKIIVGHGGRAIKKLGETSRKEIEGQLARPIFLELRVKVHPEWRKDQEFIRSVSSG